MTHIAPLLFDEVDLIDVSGPYEVFLTANRMAERRGGPERDPGTGRTRRWLRLRRQRFDRVT